MKSISCNKYFYPDGSAARKSDRITNAQVNLRQTVVQYMYDMAEIVWTCTKTADYTFNSKSLLYEAGKTYMGMTYNNNRNGLEGFQAALDSENKYRLDNVDWNTAPGNSCATSIRHAWQMVSPDVEYAYSVDMIPTYKESHVVPVGKLNWKAFNGRNTTKTVLLKTPKNDVFEAYAAALPGDGFMRYLDNGGHALMLTLNPTVTRDAEGIINPDESFVYLTDQNNLMNTLRAYPSSWKKDRKVSFTQCYKDGWLPVSTKEMQEGSAPVPGFKLEASLQDRVAGPAFFHGWLNSNYCLMSVTARVLGEDGQVVTKASLHPYKRYFEMEELSDQVDFASLAKGRYELVLSAKVGFGEFVLGQAAFRR